MGIVLGKTDSRRISFNNGCSLKASALAVDKISYELGKSSQNVKNYETRFSYKTDFLNDPDNYWSRRLESLNNEQMSINKIVEKEFASELEFTQKIFDRPPLTPEKNLKLKQCNELRQMVLDCYDINSNQPLSCSPIVRAFRKCVSQFQQEV